MRKFLLILTMSWSSCCLYAGDNDQVLPDELETHEQESSVDSACYVDEVSIDLKDRTLWPDMVPEQHVNRLVINVGPRDKEQWQIIREKYPDVKELVVKSLSIRWTIGIDFIVSNYSELSSLDLSGLSIRPERVKQIADSKNMESLVKLNLSGNAVGSEGVGYIANSPYLANLEYLNLSNNNIYEREGGMGYLANSPYLKKLKELYLDNNVIKNAGVIKLVASENVKNLEVLSLNSNLIGPFGAQKIADSEYLQSLRVLNLRNNGIKFTGAYNLVISPNYKKLETLRIGSNGLDFRHGYRTRKFKYNPAQHARLFMQDWQLTSLKTLDLSNNYVGIDLIREMFLPRYKLALDELDLSNNRDIKAEAVELIANTPLLENLKVLNLSRIGDVNAGIIAIVTSKYITNLTHFYAAGLALNKKSYNQLINSTNFDNLIELVVPGNWESPDQYIFEIPVKRKFRFVKFSNGLERTF
jgi:Leucine Rich Repeat (LRR) protein